MCLHVSDESTYQCDLMALPAKMCVIDYPQGLDMHHST